MAIQSTDARRTIRARIVNQRQAARGLDALGFATSKLWNVARWTVARIWNEAGALPEAGYLKNRERYADLHSQTTGSHKKTDNIDYIRFLSTHGL